MNKPFRDKQYDMLQSAGLCGPGVWDDSKFPFTGQGIDTTTGRLSYDYDELGISLAANARYAQTEQISMMDQTSHQWAEGSLLHPHIHWIQTSEDVPNFMLEYRKYNNGESPGAFVQVVLDTEEVFTYPGSGTILQISTFPEIDMTGCRISCFTDYKFFRDSANASGLFAGADPLGSAVTVKEFDVHFLKDSAGSVHEFIKQTKPYSG